MVVPNVVLLPCVRAWTEQGSSNLIGPPKQCLVRKKNGGSKHGPLHLDGTGTGTVVIGATATRKPGDAIHYDNGLMILEKDKQATRSVSFSLSVFRENVPAGTAGERTLGVRTLCWVLETTKMTYLIKLGCGTERVQPK